MRNPGWMKHKLESRLWGEISITSDMQMTPPYGRKQRGAKEPLDESERGQWKTWLKTQHSKGEDHGIWSHHFTAYIWGNNENSDRLYFFGIQNHCRWWLQPWNSKMLAPWKKSNDQPRQHIKKQRIHFAYKGLYSQSYGFSRSHACMDVTVGLSAKKLMLSNMVLEKTLRVPWTARR